ncbi:hypothetical protein ACMGDM_17030 [Sphingomonas sp. DT-51]|uniref:hypothetical protein n=1 Tax=Sphingomonas sp. DT-51 TaxID=3396165 RepID=UPI003F1B0414
MQSGCSTAAGVELWRKQANIDTIITERLRESVVTAEDVRPPLEALDTASLMRETAGSDHRKDYEVKLEGDDQNSALYRRSGNWRYVEEEGDGFQLVKIDNLRTGVSISYSREKDGTRRLGWSRPPWALQPRKEQFSGRSLRGEPAKTILGERCSMYDMMPGVMDAGRLDCLTRDGVPLISNRSSWGRLRSWKAVRLSRKSQPLPQVTLTHDITDPLEAAPITCTSFRRDLPPRTAAYAQLRTFDVGCTMPLMPQLRLTSRVVGLIVGGAACAAAGYAFALMRQYRVTMEQPHTTAQAAIDQSRKRFGGSPMVQDAIRRWTPRNGGIVAKAVSGYQIQVVDTPSLSCVKFTAIAYDVGGEPTYCYEPHTARLVWENSDVE